MAEATLLQHRHCMVCGKAILGEDFTCSSACKERLGQRKKRRQFLFLGWFTLVGVTLILYVTTAGGPG